MPYKRNNPGNIRPFVKYLGSTPDGPFLKFDTLTNGFRAIFLDIKTKRNRGVKTLKEYFRIYAPEADNNQPDKYAAFVAGKIGTTLLPSAPGQLVPMALAIGEMEHGKRPTPEDMTAARNGLAKAEKNEKPDPIKPDNLTTAIAVGLGAYFLVKFFRK